MAGVTSLSVRSGMHRRERQAENYVVFLSTLAYGKKEEEEKKVQGTSRGEGGKPIYKYSGTWTCYLSAGLRSDQASRHEARLSRGRAWQSKAEGMTADRGGAWRGWRGSKEAEDDTVRASRGSLSLSAHCIVQRFTLSVVSSYSPARACNNVRLKPFPLLVRSPRSPTRPTSVVTGER